MGYSAHQRGHTPRARMMGHGEQRMLAACILMEQVTSCTQSSCGGTGGLPRAAGAVPSSARARIAQNTGAGCRWRRSRACASRWPRPQPPFSHTPGPDCIKVDIDPLANNAKGKVISMMLVHHACMDPALDIRGYRALPRSCCTHTSSPTQWRCCPPCQSPLCLL